LHANKFTTRDDRQRIWFPFSSGHPENRALPYATEFFKKVLDEYITSSTGIRPDAAMQNVLSCKGMHSNVSYLFCDELFKLGISLNPEDSLKLASDFLFNSPYKSNG